MQSPQMAMSVALAAHPEAPPQDLAKLTRAGVALAGIAFVVLQLVLATALWFGIQRQVDATDSVYRYKEGKSAVLGVLRGAHELVVTDGSASARQLLLAAVKKLETMDSSVGFKRALASTKIDWPDLDRRLSRFVARDNVGTTDIDSLIELGRLSSDAGTLIDWLDRETDSVLQAAAQARKTLYSLLAVAMITIFLATLAYCLTVHRRITRPLTRALTIAAHTLNESEAQFRNAFLQCGMGFQLTALDGKFLEVNEKFCEITGYTRDELLTMSVHDTQTPEEAEESRKFRAEMVSGHRQSGHRERELIRKGGATIWVSSSISLVRDDRGNPLHFMSVTQDITQQLLAERRIEHLATKDTLTGLCNRSALTEQMHAAIARAARMETQFAVMFIDLDKFKTVNDTLGHTAGDELLRECAKRLIDCVRDFDIVARLGGDEFVVMLNDITGANAVSSVADRMLKQLKAPYNLHGHDARTSASIGICLYPTDGKDVTTLMKNADIAMYNAKEQKRDNYQFYAPEMNERMLRRQQLERELREAIQNNQFVLHYQPQVTVATGEISGAESLVRWHHPTLGVLPPSEFISVAEETGMIVPLGEWILNHACGTIKSWREKGIGIPYIVVNVSTAQLGDGLVAMVRQALVNHGIAPGWLMLEITETMLMENVEEAISILRRIRELGVRIAMDDFGTGYSSLSVLQRLPLDTLKIDRSFVSAIDDETANTRAAAIIGAIIAIAKELNLRVVAEGVETTTQLAYLRTLNCDSYQGYLFSKPLETMNLESRLAEPPSLELLDRNGRPITMTLKVALELPIASGSTPPTPKI